MPINQLVVRAADEAEDIEKDILVKLPPLGRV